MQLLVVRELMALKDTFRGTLKKILAYIQVYR